MTAAPRWEQVDGSTGTLLDLLADDGSTSPSKAEEWETFVYAMRFLARGNGGEIRPNLLRPLVRGNVKPSRIGAFHRRACLEGLIAPTGEWEISDDTEGRNSGRPMRCYRWVGDQPAKCTACHGRGSRVHGYAVCAAECRDCGGTGESA